MTRLAILLLGLVSLVSCDNWRHEFWKTSNNLNKGYVKNCGKNTMESDDDDNDDDLVSYVPFNIN